MAYHRILNKVPYAIQGTSRNLFICSIGNSLYLLTLNFHSIPPFPLSNHKSVFYVCVWSPQFTLNPQTSLIA